MGFARERVVLGVVSHVHDNSIVLTRTVCTNVQLVAGVVKTTAVAVDSGSSVVVV